MSNDWEIFRKHARQRLEELNLTVTELAKRVNEPQSNVSMYLTGKRNPKWEKIEKYAKGLECDPHWLAGRTEPSEESVRVREQNEWEIASAMLQKFLPEGERKDAALLLLGCDDDTFKGIVGGLRPFLQAARKAKDISTG